MQPSYHQAQSAWQQTVFPPTIDVRSLARSGHGLHNATSRSSANSKLSQRGSSHLQNLLNGVSSDSQHGRDTTSRLSVVDSSKIFDLPELPVRTGKATRPRLPPTLSGLHEPPPNAGLLPSISTAQPYNEKNQTTTTL